MLKQVVQYKFCLAFDKSRLLVHAVVKIPLSSTFVNSKDFYSQVQDEVLLCSVCPYVHTCVHTSVLVNFRPKCSGLVYVGLIRYLV